MLAQQPDRLDELTHVPGLTTFERLAECGPAPEQPQATGGGRFQAEDDRLGVVEDASGGGLEPAADETEERIVKERIVESGLRCLAALADEPPAQRGGLFLLAAGQLVGDRPHDRGQAGGLDPVGPLDLPRGGRRLLDQELLDRVAGRQVVGPVADAGLKCLGILARQHRRRGGQAVLDGVQLRTLLSLRAPRPGTLKAVAPADLGSVLGSGRHRGPSSRVGLHRRLGPRACRSSRGFRASGSCRLSPGATLLDRTLR